MRASARARARGTDSARVIHVIETKAIRGLGTEKDPARIVTQYWDLDGNFLAEADTEHSHAIIEHEAKMVKESILDP
ncbi:MAG: carboxypeptidase [Lachnospiraceae bacterium]|nr:carboxypeptidase [Lachnospiraceae bacterium]